MVKSKILDCCYSSRNGHVKCLPGIHFSRILNFEIHLNKEKCAGVQIGLALNKFYSIFGRRMTKRPKLSETNLLSDSF